MGINIKGGVSMSVSTAQRLIRLHDSLHHINLENEELLEKEITVGNLNEYIEDLINTLIGNETNRNFKFASETTEVCSGLKTLLEDKENIEMFKVFSNLVANRLFRKEQDVQEEIRQLTKLKKGSLIQSLIKYNNDTLLIISKVEHETFLNADELVKQIGLPFDKKALKTCIIFVNEKNEIGEIIVADSNRKIASYWYKDFLELLEVNSDENNTQMAFKSIDFVLTKQVKKQSPADHTILRNSLIGYFKTQESFNFDHLVESVFGQYQPEYPDKFDMSTLKQKITNLPSDRKFDTSFNIVSNVINAKIKKVIKISDKIDLNLKDHIDQLKHVIKALEKDNGDKFLEIRIENEEAYEAFKYENEE